MARLEAEKKKLLSPKQKEGEGAASTFGMTRGRLPINSKKGKSGELLTAASAGKIKLEPKK